MNWKRIETFSAAAKVCELIVFPLIEFWENTENDKNSCYVYG